MTVQTPFLDGHTPLVWAITSIPEGSSRQTHSSLPSWPLIFFLLTWSTKCGERWRAVYDSAAEACCEANNNSLFQVLNLRGRGTQASLGSSEFYYTMSHFGEEDFNFTIYDFDREMSRSRCIDLRLLFQGEHFATTGLTHLSYSLICRSRCLRRTSCAGW